MSNGFETLQEQYNEARIAHITEQLARAEVTADSLQEAYSAAVQQMYAMEDIGWQRLGGPRGEGPGNDLAECKLVAAKLSKFSETNPLLVRGREIRNSYQFSDPYDIGTKDAKGKITPQQWNIINKPENQEAVFALSALEVLEGERFSAGNVFVQWNRTEKVFQPIPFDEITDVIYDPMDKSKLRYIKREVSYETIDDLGRRAAKHYAAWIPVSNYEPEGKRYALKIDNVEVDPNLRMIVSRVNRKVGSVFGVPDAFAAAPWALAYSAYLRDGTKVLAALAEWVWKITPKKKNPAERAAASVRKERGAGGTLFTDMDVQQLPKADAVDLNTGRPLAAQTAAALGISVVVLLADPGQSGAYGTAQTLSDPNRRTMQARREVNSQFLIECLRMVGIKDADIIWSKMAPGTDLEEQRLLSGAWGTGLFHPDEIRQPLAKVAKITLNHEEPPSGLLVPNNAASAQRSDIDLDGDSSTVGMDGSNEMSNGVGRNAEKQGALSRIAQSDAEKAAQA